MIRWLLLFSVLLGALALVGCGGSGSGDGSSESSEKQVTTMSKAEIAKLTEPKVSIPPGPPPTKLVVKDLREGTGVAAKPSDAVVVNDVGLSYRTGKIFESTWSGPAARPSRFPLEEVIQGWEEGVPGMKVGGRRELIVPSKLAYGQGPVLYVIDLLGVEQSRSSSGAGVTG